MLDTFRRRDNARTGSNAAHGARAPAGGPQVRIADGAIGAGLQVERPPFAVSPPPENPKPVAPAAVEPSAPAALPQRGARENARLTVGPDIKLQGAQITDCDTLIVEGQVDACMDSRVVEVAEHGVFRGKVQVDSAEIRGRFEGELTAHKQLAIRAGGRVAGKIRYGKLLVDEGGEIAGDVAAVGSDPTAQTLSGKTDERNAGEAPRAQEDTAALLRGQGSGAVR